MAKKLPYVKIERAKILESNLKWFTDPSSDLISDGEWELVNEDKTLHPQSKEFVEAVQKISEARSVINSILS